MRYPKGFTQEQKDIRDAIQLAKRMFKYLAWLIAGIIIALIIKRLI